MSTDCLITASTVTESTLTAFSKRTETIVAQKSFKKELIHYFLVLIPSSDDESDTAILQLKALIDSQVQNSTVDPDALLMLVTDEVTLIIRYLHNCKPHYLITREL